MTRGKKKRQRTRIALKNYLLTRALASAGHPITGHDKSRERSGNDRITRGNDAPENRRRYTYILTRRKSHLNSSDRTAGRTVNDVVRPRRADRCRNKLFRRLLFADRRAAGTTSESRLRTDSRPGPHAGNTTEP